MHRSSVVWISHMQWFVVHRTASVRQTFIIMRFNTSWNISILPRMMAYTIGAPLQTTPSLPPALHPSTERAMIYFLMAAQSTTHLTSMVLLTQTGPHAPKHVVSYRSLRPSCWRYYCMQVKNTTNSASILDWSQVHGCFRFWTADPVHTQCALGHWHATCSCLHPLWGQ